MERNTGQMERIDKVIAYLLGKGFIKSNIATMLGMSYACYYSYFVARKQIGYKVAQKIEDVFGISSQWIMTGDGEMIVREVCANNKDLSKTQLISRENARDNNINSLSHKVNMMESKLLEMDNKLNSILEMQREIKEQNDMILALLKLK